MKTRPRSLSTRWRDFACGLFLLVAFAAGSASRCAASDQERLLVRDGKRLVCTVRFADSLGGDCGTESYEAVFTAKVLTVESISRPPRNALQKAMKASYPQDVRLTVKPTEIFKGSLKEEVQILAEQGECFEPFRVGDDWLFFATKGVKKNELTIYYFNSNPSGPVEQNRAAIEQLRRLQRGDGLGFVTGEVDFPSADLSKGDLADSRPNHKVIIQSDDGKQNYTVQTDAQGRFAIGPVAPASFRIDANTDPQYRDVWTNTGGTTVRANGCSIVRIELEVNSEISGRVILPQGYTVKEPVTTNAFPLFNVEVYTADGKQAGGTFIDTSSGELRFTVRGLPPGSYVVQLANYVGEPWVIKTVYAPGVTDRKAALEIDLGRAEHRTGLEICVPMEALRREK